MKHDPDAKPMNEAARRQIAEDGGNPGAPCNKPDEPSSSAQDAPAARGPVQGSGGTGVAGGSNPQAGPINPDPNLPPDGSSQMLAKPSGGTLLDVCPDYDDLPDPEPAEPVSEEEFCPSPRPHIPICDELRAARDALAYERDRHTCDVQSLRHQIATLTRENEIYKRDNQSLERRAEKLIRERDDNLDEARATNALYEQACRERDEARAERDKAQGLLGAERNQVATLRAEAGRLQGKLDRYDPKFATRWHANAAELTKQLAEKEIERDDLWQQVERLTNKLAEKEAQYELVVQQATEAGHTIADLKAKLATARELLKEGTAIECNWPLWAKAARAFLADALGDEP